MIEVNKDFEESWKKLLDFFKQTLGKKPADLKGVLFLIGVQELGKGNLPFSKEEKQDLIHIAVCKVMSFAGYYTLIGYDEDSWPHWELTKTLPAIDMFSQESLLKHFVIEYFRTEIGLHI
jgi:hypothetical protein